MSSLLSLPPETRTNIYNVLLQSSLASETRILYLAKNSRHHQGVSGSLRRRISYKTNGRILTFGNRDNDGQPSDTMETTTSVHLADVDDLLFLANTCRLLRSEILAIAWSNADISFRPAALSRNLQHVFFNRLSSNTCSFISSLQVETLEMTFAPQGMTKTTSLIRQRLPHLQQLVINIPTRLVQAAVTGNTFDATLMVLRGLPPAIEVHFHSYFAFSSPVVFTEMRMQSSHIALNARFATLRAQDRQRAQGRRNKQAKRKQEDRVAGMLEATIELRALW